MRGCVASVRALGLTPDLIGGAELAALGQEHAFYHLEAPIERVTGWDTPYPHAFEWEYFPGPLRVAAALKAVMEAA